MQRESGKRKHGTEMYEAILELKTVDECVRFFEDLCASTELRMLEQRYDVAKLLLQGKVYAEIMRETGASSATISRVNRMLENGHGTEEEKIEALARKKRAGAGEADSV